MERSFLARTPMATVYTGSAARCESAVTVRKERNGMEAVREADGREGQQRKEPERTMSGDDLKPEL